MTGDIYNIEERLKEQDPDLSMSFNPSGTYSVLHKGNFVLEWPRPLDARLLTHMRKIDMRRGYDPLREIDEHNESLERVIEKDRLNHIEAVVKDSKRQLQREL